MKWITDFFRYINAYISGGAKYRENWNNWRVAPAEHSEIHDVGAESAARSSSDLQRIDNENQRIKDELENILPKESVESSQSRPADLINATDDDAKKLDSGQNVNLPDSGCPVSNKPIINSDIQESYQKLLYDCADIIKELDTYNRQVNDEEAKAITETIPHHIIEAIANGSVDIIDSEPKFDILLHTPMPVRPVQQGTMIQEYIRPGIKIGRKVIIRAIVSV